jgi:hypothetical protein
MEILKGAVDGFSYFVILFQLFSFLARIIPGVIYSSKRCHDQSSSQAFFNKEYITFSGGLIMTSFGRVYNTRDDSGKKRK